MLWLEILNAIAEHLYLAHPVLEQEEGVDLHYLPQRDAVKSAWIISVQKVPIVGELIGQRVDVVNGAGGQVAFRENHLVAVLRSDCAREREVVEAENRVRQFVSEMRSIL